MPLKSVVLLLSLLLLGACRTTAPHSQAKSFSLAANGQTTKYINGRWFDGSNFSPHTVYVRSGRFVPPSKHVDRVVDLREALILLPFAEAHNHNLQNCAQVPAIAEKYISAGILYSAQLAASDPAISECAQFFSSNKSPQVAWAHIVVTSHTGHPLGIARRGANEAGLKLSDAQVAPGLLLADSPAEFETKWKEAAHNTDFVKVILIDSQNWRANYANKALDGYNGISPETLSAVVKSAHQRGLRVIAHVDTAKDFELAVDSGVDAIGHLPGYRVAEGFNIQDYRISESVVQKAAMKGISIIPTIAASYYYRRAKPVDAQDIIDNYISNLELLKKHGIMVLSGSDRYEANVLDELATLRDTGLFEERELLRMSTIDTPRWMFPNRKVGCFDIGCEASFLIYQNVNEIKIDASLTPTAVYERGALLNSPDQRPKGTEEINLI